MGFKDFFSDAVWLICIGLCVGLGITLWFFVLMLVHDFVRLL